MANLTITVDDEELRRARLRALEQGTSVNVLLREYLAAYAGAREAQARRIQRVPEIARRPLERKKPAMRPSNTL